MHKYLLAIPFVFSSAAIAVEPCPFKKWDTYQGVSLLKEPGKGAYLFASTEVKVDADGAPNAYHPDDIGLNCKTGTGFKGLDCPANGGYPNSDWWRSAIAPDPKNNNKAYVQTKGDFKGFFVSRTSLVDKTKTDLDTTKYVDSRSVPYLVFPGKFYSKAGTGHLGDFGYALNIQSGKASPFIVAEVGPPSAHLGEMSIFLGNALGGNNPNPRTGAGVPKGKTIYVVFPSSKNSPTWPVNTVEMDSKVALLLDGIGGVEQLKSCAEPL
ncbi:hypothetical protein M5G22_19320 [Pseudomonas sp. TNT2022 ID233]|jgi:hypothetical protein|uniref:glycoside hydrolase family 75 protein n=1 Tax=Pseudomonas aphyarum TaxID=2942629 RepID=UPI0023609881|nr:glycoside hydrolase family 75 protein [Pseudomonas aphyarum]MDD1139715.1 hypothetical protein [Pseudomonas aphyarum]